ncbi:MAG: segregation and condensation protein A [Candidatus Binatia bacterium]
MDTTVKLEIFEGPLDLLLHLIKKIEVSITDIPIATITEQYLATLEVMQSLSLDVAGEFLVMAATLVHIKSRMLLPPQEEEADDDEEGDPKEELIRRLLEYQRFKEAAQSLEGQEILRRDVFTRPSAAPEAVEAVEFERLSLFDLIAALRHVLEQLPEERIHEVVLERVSVREKMNLLLDDLHRKGKVVFQSLFEQATSRLEVVVTFLAMLELIKMRAVRVWQEERLGPILLEMAAPLGEIHDRLAGEGGGDGA